MKIIVEKKSLVELNVEAIVNPANSLGYMGGGVAGVIKRVGGEQIEKSAVAQAPIAVGEAVLTEGGKLPCKWVIHAPTMERPAQKTDSEKVFRAVSAAIKLAKKKGIKSLAFPGMGAGIGRVKPEDSAKAVVDAIRNFAENEIELIYLVDVNDEMVNAFRRAVESQQ